MVLKAKLLLAGIFLILTALPAVADNVNPAGLLTISGYVKDAESGESLIGADSVGQRVEYRYHGKSVRVLFIESQGCKISD